MKAFKRIGAFLLALMVSLSSLTISIFAEESHDGHDHTEAIALSDTTPVAPKCGEGDVKNVALGADVIGDRGPGSTLGDVFWSVSDHYYCAVDGDPDTFCVLDTTHWKAYGLWITLEDSYVLSSLEIQTFGIGRSPTSKGASDQVIGRRGEFPFTVSLYGVNGEDLGTYNATGTPDKNTTINLGDLSSRVHKIYIYVAQEYVSSGPFQGIWEVYAYSNDIHNWQDVEEMIEPSCSQPGKMAVKCADCNAEKEAYIPTTAHTDTCKGVCDECGATIAVNHEGANGCTSTECKKCGETLTASAHVANTANPCDTTCAKCGAENVIDVSANHIADQDNPCSNDCARCGAKGVIKDAYYYLKQPLTSSIYWTSKVFPYTYAKHVANPNNPCDSTCYKCGKAQTVAPVHTPGAETGTWAQAQNDGAGITINPCSSTQCAECGELNAYPANPHVNITVPQDGKYPCGRKCAKCGTGWGRWYTHQFDNCGDSTCNVCNSSIADKERAHSFTAESPVVCVDCGFALACPGHTYENACDAKCDFCGYQRYNQRTGTLDYWHIYDNACDTTCNDCGEVRTITHSYPSAACAKYCTVCGFERDTAGASHTYSNVSNGSVVIENSSACDTTCDACGEVRTVTHSYAYICAGACSICKATRDASALHEWDGPCDTDCNTVGCNQTRVAEHQWDSACDTECNVDGCGYTRETTHEYSSVCDTECDVPNCGFKRENAAKHVFKDACDSTCNNEGCGYIRTAQTDNTFDPDHEYDNACDSTCNICGATRTVGPHVFTNACDNVCDVCGNPIPGAGSPHVFGAYVVTKEPTVDSEGEQVRTCTVCGVADTPVTLPKAEDEGLGTGAIIGIASGSVVVLGGGGFSLWWFILRKKFLKD